MKETRWSQRFENFERAYILLYSAFDEKNLSEFSMLEKEGIFQRFEYTFELAWKTLKDYLVYTGIELEQFTPRTVFKQAYAANIIADGQDWIEMLEQRNMMSHTYNIKTFEKTIESVQKKYLPLFKELYLFLKEQDKTT